MRQRSDRVNRSKGSNGRDSVHRSEGVDRSDGVDGSNGIEGSDGVDVSGRVNERDNCRSDIRIKFKLRQLEQMLILGNI